MDLKSVRCACAARHRTYRAVAACIWKNAAWIADDGPFAVLAWCRTLTVTLHGTEAAAEGAKRLIDRTGCGGGCHRRHEIVRLEMKAATSGGAKASPPGHGNAGR